MALTASSRAAENADKVVEESVVEPAAASQPSAPLAVGQADTTVMYGGSKVVIGVADGETHISVYERDTVKVKECTFIEGNDIGRVSVSSPFAAAEMLQDMSMEPNLPTVWAGMGTLDDKAFGRSADGVGSKQSGSFELGVTPVAFVMPLDKAHTVGFVTGAQLVFTRTSFRRDFAMTNSGSLIDCFPVQSATGHSMCYGTLRVPLLLGMQEPHSRGAASFGLSAELRTNAAYRLKTAETVPGVPDGLKLKRAGLNMEVNLCYGPFCLGGRIGLTPLYETTGGVKAYTKSFTLGVNIQNLCRMLRKKNK